MTELEWAEVTTSFTEMFDILMKIAPEQINGNKAFRAGTILNEELKRIRQKKAILSGGMLRGGMTNMSSTGLRGNENLDEYNAKIEKKKQEIHDVDAANFLTLEQKLKASIEKVERERQK